MSLIEHRKGFTLIEMVLVMVILGILATVAMKSLKSFTDQSRFDITTEEMERLARAIIGDERLVSAGVRTDFGYVGDVGALPSNLDALVTNPGGYSTWNGPYIRSDFSENTEDYKRDAWNEPYTYNGGVIITSNGGGNTITKQFASSVNDLTSNTIKGIVRDSDLSPPGDSASSITVTVQYPNGTGSLTISSTSPSASGEFSFSNSIPIGLHRLQANIDADTISKYVAVYPGKTIYTELRFAGDLW